MLEQWISRARLPVLDLAGGSHHSSRALTLSPAPAALLLGPHAAKLDALTRGIDKAFGRFFAWFNHAGVMRLCVWHILLSSTGS